MMTLAKNVAAMYQPVASIASVAAHPVRSVQDSLRGYLLGQCVKLIVSVAGDRAAEELEARVKSELAVDWSIEVPGRARAMVQDKELLTALNQGLDDALAAPLAALGLRIGKLMLTPLDEGERLRIQGVFKLAKITSDSSSLPVELQH